MTPTSALSISTRTGFRATGSCAALPYFATLNKNPTLTIVLELPKRNSLDILFKIEYIEFTRRNLIETYLFAWACLSIHISEPQRFRKEKRYKQKSEVIKLLRSTKNYPCFLSNNVCTHSKSGLNDDRPAPGYSNGGLCASWRLSVPFKWERRTGESKAARAPARKIGRGS